MKMKRVEKIAKDCPELVAEFLADFHCDLVSNYYDMCDEVDNCKECQSKLLSYLMEEVEEDVQCGAE